MKMVDLILFMGQSNMAGRGNASEAPSIIPGAGYEYRAISAPDRLSPAIEPFGAMEQNPQGVYEPGMKTGSLAVAFMNACYDRTKVPVVGVSCSKGGSSIREWEKDSLYDRDAVERYEKSCCFLREQNIGIRSVSLAWCQGCTDGDNGMTEKEYFERTRCLFEIWLSRGIGQVFLIQIGNHRDKPELYVPIQKMQKRLSEEMETVVLVSEKFKTLAEQGLMKDCFHYKQQGYNLVGEDAGQNAGAYLKRCYGDENGVTSSQEL